MPKSVHPACNWLIRHFSLTVLLRAGLAVAAIISATAVSAAAAPHFVDPAGICGGNVPCYTTIQAAVNAAAPGDTINVGPGTYPELVTVNKQLTLRGARTRIDARSCRTGLAATESVVTGNAGSTSFYVTANDVTIDGFTVQGQTNVNLFGAGIVLGAGTSGAHVQSNIIQNNVVGLFLANNPLGNQAVIRFNLFRNNNNAGSASGHGIYSDESVAGPAVSNVLIDSNDFRDTTATGGSWGIGMSNTDPAVPFTNLQIKNNTFDSTSAGSRGMYFYGTDASSIQGNSILNKTNYAIGVFGNDDGITIECNTIRNSNRGIYIGDSFTGVNSLISANNNNISGNLTAGLEVFTGTHPGIVDAENNWWGSASGPTIASNPSGTGDAIIDPDFVVDYTPFATSLTTCPTVAVTPANQMGWVFFDDFPGMGTGSGGLETGPATPPLGVGSAYLLVDANGRFAVGTGAYVGTRMDAIGELGYSTYQNNNANPAAAIALQFDIDYDLIDNSNLYEGRLVFEPYLSATVLQNVWQTWNPIPGLWYGTRANVTVSNALIPNPCLQATPCTWQQVLALYPNAGVRNPGALLFKAGGPVGSNFDGNVDAFKIRIGTNRTVFDFEPTTATNKTAGDNQGTLVNTPFPINLQLTVVDGTAAGIPNVPVTFTAPSSGASGTFAGGCLTVTVITDANGVATAPQFTANGQAGYYTVTATGPGIPPANFALRNMISPTAADGTISGQVNTPGGHPVAGVVIQLSGAQTRKTITDASGNYRFDNVETSGFYTVAPSLRNYSFGPASRSFSQLGNVTEAVFTANPDAVIVGNLIETSEYFVRQHYLDFLGREPDEAGFNFWSDQILGCGVDVGCLERRRINVSAAYFLSVEFQQTGGLIDGLYRATFNRRPLYAEFIPDTRTIARNIVVNRGGWEQQLQVNKEEFVDAFVQRAEFRAAFDGLSNENYIATLVAHTGVAFSESERDALVSDLAGSRLTRAAVLLRIAEDQRFVTAKRNEAFVMMQYFGYLRRDPDEDGYQFWLDKLNRFGGNFEQAEMVKAFITAGEYRARF